MPSWRRYVRARGVFHDANTAVIAPSSCSRGSSGKSRPVWLAADLQELLDRAPRARPRRDRRRRRRRAQLLARVSASSNTSLGTPSTTFAYICTKRRCESAAKRGVPDASASPRGERGFSPRFRIVSIIPGIDTGEPERTETRSGSSGSPRRLPQRSSSAARCLDTCSSRPSGHVPPASRIRAACLGRHGEAVRNGEADRGHLGELGALPSEDVAHLARAVCEGVDVGLPRPRSLAGTSRISRPREERSEPRRPLQNTMSDSDRTAEPRARRRTARAAASKGRAVLRTGSAEGPMRGRLPNGGRPRHIGSRLGACR